LALQRQSAVVLSQQLPFAKNPTCAMHASSNSVTWIWYHPELLRLYHFEHLAPSLISLTDLGHVGGGKANMSATNSKKKRRVSGEKKQPVSGALRGMAGPQ
jgi:hypothetical protein